jgi:hypothetical protein
VGHRAILVAHDGRRVAIGHHANDRPATVDDRHETAIVLAHDFGRLGDGVVAGTFADDRFMFSSTSISSSSERFQYYQVPGFA